MEKGKIYKVEDEDGRFYMVGECISVGKKDVGGDYRGRAHLFTSMGIISKNSEWCYLGYGRIYREANQLEIDWYKHVMLSGKFTLLEEYQKEYQPVYEIY